MALEKDVIINPTDEFTLTIQGTSKTKTVTYYTLFKKILGNITFPEVLPEEDTLDTVTTRGNTTFNTISVGGVTTNYTLYNTTYVAALQEGMMAWNSADGTLDLRLLGNNVTLQIGQEQVVRVVNKTGVDLLEANYQAVKITGAQGNRLKVGLARADSDPNSADTIGLVTETITNNQEGFVTSSGLVRGINTTGALQSETWADGDVVYLSPTTFGAITNVKPLAPQHTVIMGFVVRAHPTQGQIYVKVDNGYEIDELHNVRITSVANNQILQYDSTLSVWKNVNLSTAGIVSGSGVATRVAFWDGTNSISSDSQLYWDNSLKNLGIGTANPVEKLVISDNGAMGFEFQPSTGRFYRYDRVGMAYGSINAEFDNFTFSVVRPAVFGPTPYTALDFGPFLGGIRIFTTNESYTVPLNIGYGMAVGGSGGSYESFNIVRITDDKTILYYYNDLTPVGNVLSVGYGVSNGSDCSLIVNGDPTSFDSTQYSFGVFDRYNSGLGKSFFENGTYVRGGIYKNTGAPGTPGTNLNIEYLMIAYSIALS